MVKSILFLSDIGGYQGGVERFIVQAAGALRNSGIVCGGLFAREGRNSSEFSQAFDSVTFGYENITELAADYDAIWVHKCDDCSCWESLLGVKPVVVYVHDHDYTCFRCHKYWPIGRINCTLPSGFYCRICGSIARKHRNWSRFKRNLELLRRADRVIAGSDFMLETLVDNRIEEKKLKKLEPLISFPVSSRAMRDPHKGELLYVGQLIRGKGVDLLLHAVAGLTEKWHLTIVGDGSDAAFLKKLAEKLHLGDRVEFVGFSMTPELFYKQASALVFPSRWQEPFGMTGPEALAHGVPVIGFDVGGVGEYLEDGVTGLVVPPGNVVALRRALEQVLHDRNAALRWGDNGRLAMENYNEESFCGKVAAIFGDLR